VARAGPADLLAGERGERQLATRRRLGVSEREHAGRHRALHVRRPAAVDPAVAALDDVSTRVALTGRLAVSRRDHVVVADEREGVGVVVVRLTFISEHAAGVVALDPRVGLRAEPLLDRVAAGGGLVLVRRDRDQLLRQIREFVHRAVWVLGS